MAGVRPNMVGNPSRGELIFFQSPFAPENVLSRDRSGRTDPRQPSYSPHRLKYSTRTLILNK